MLSLHELVIRAASGVHYPSLEMKQSIQGLSQHLRKLAHSNDLFGPSRLTPVYGIEGVTFLSNFSIYAEHKHHLFDETGSGKRNSSEFMLWGSSV